MKLSSFQLAIVAAFAAWGAAPAYAQIAPAPFEPLSITGPNPQEQFQDISIEQNLEAQVPIEMLVRDEAGNLVTLTELMDNKPAILALVYYECPMLCNIVLDGVEGVIDAMKYDIGDDYNVLTLSIDPGETPELAARKKANHLERLGRSGAQDGWHFLTADEDTIDAVADTVGFRYAYDPATDQYAHAAGIMVLTPRGKIARYYYGVEYIARDVEFGLVEASQGRIGSVVDQLVLLCFQYDPATGQYGVYIIGAMRIMAALMILGFALMYTTLYLRGRKKKREQARADASGGSPESKTPLGQESTHNA